MHFPAKRTAQLRTVAKISALRTERYLETNDFQSISSDIWRPRHVGTLLYLVTYINLFVYGVIVRPPRYSDVSAEKIKSERENTA